MMYLDLHYIKFCMKLSRYELSFRATHVSLLTCPCPQDSMKRTLRDFEGLAMA